MPAEKHGIRVVSMGFLADSKAPIIWRGPMLHGVVRQFFQDVRWGELDYLVIDMPPGTGDVALSLTQTVPVAGAIVVTTPQAVSLADTRRAVAMSRKLEVGGLRFRLGGSEMTRHVDRRPDRRTALGWCPSLGT